MNRLISIVDGSTFAQRSRYSPTSHGIWAGRGCARGPAQRSSAVDLNGWPEARKISGQVAAETSRQRSGHETPFFGLNSSGATQPWNQDARGFPGSENAAVKESVVQVRSTAKTRLPLVLS